MDMDWHMYWDISNILLWYYKVVSFSTQIWPNQSSKDSIKIISPTIPVLQVSSLLRLPSRTPSSLVTRSPATPFRFQRADIVLHVKVSLLYTAYIDHVHNVLYRDAGLGYVGGDHYLAHTLWWSVKYLCNYSLVEWVRFGEIMMMMTGFNSLFYIAWPIQFCHLRIWMPDLSHTQGDIITSVQFYTICTGFPIKEGIQFNILLNTFKAIWFCSCPWLILFLPVLDNIVKTWSLCKHYYGDRAFAVASPKLWNNIPYHIQSINVFKNRLTYKCN